MVDYRFVIRNEGGQILNGYVPNRNGVPLGHSGVTIASGFDIGQHDTNGLNRIFGSGSDNQDLKDKYTPYLLLKKKDAMDFLENNPLFFTKDQADKTDSAVMSQELSSIIGRYNDAVGCDFDSLPDQAQTALFDLGYQYGTAGMPEKLMKKIADGDYSGAAKYLREMEKSSGYPYRRNAEADLLSQLSNIKPQA